MNRVKRQELGNELQSSRHLGLQSVSCRLSDVATVPAQATEVQLKKSIFSIHKAHVGPWALARAGPRKLASAVARRRLGKWPRISAQHKPGVRLCGASLRRAGGRARPYVFFIK